MSMAKAVIHSTTGANMEYRGLISDDETFPTWDPAAANEFGRLAQGVGGRIEGSNTIFFIPRSAVPRNKTVTYGRFVVDVRLNKEEVHRVRLTVGGNLIKYDGDVSTRSADLTTSTRLWNSIISTEGATYMCLDVKNFYLGTPMEEFEYLRISIKLAPSRSSPNKILSLWYPMATSTLKCRRACTDCHTLEYSPIISFPKDWHPMVTGKPKELRAYGHMTLSPSPSPLSWMILVSNMKV
jgi:hypothetical protein